MRTTGLAKIASESGAERLPFLGVTASARGFVWRERLLWDSKSLATAISQRHGLPELMGRVLAARGVGLDDVATFLDPTLKALMPDPSHLRDMDKAAARLADAIEGRQPVAIFGDYDVDGACSSALMARFLAHHETPARIYIPDRLFEGYGPNTGAIETLVAEGARLIVTVDCGTTSHEPLALARRLGADVLVIDHHQADERLPEVEAIVNPNRQDDVSGQGALCAAGVVFLVLVAMTRELRRRGFYADGTRARSSGTSRSRSLGNSCRCGAAHRSQSRLREEGPGSYAGAPERWSHGARRCRGPHRAADALSPWFHTGAAHQCGWPHRQCRAGCDASFDLDDEMEAARIAVLLNRLNKERKDIETLVLEEALAIAERQISRRSNAFDRRCRL